VGIDRRSFLGTTVAALLPLEVWAKPAELCEMVCDNGYAPSDAWLELELEDGRRGAVRLVREQLGGTT